MARFRTGCIGCDLPEAQPKRVAVDETAVKINGAWSWLYAAIDTDTKLILDVALFGRHGAGPAVAFCRNSKRNMVSLRPSFSSIDSTIGLPFFIRVERLSQLYRPKPDRKVVLHPKNAGRPLP
jgi:putative transposase